MFATRVTNYFLISFEQILKFFFKPTVLHYVTSCTRKMKYPVLDDPEGSFNQKLTRSPIAVSLFHQPAVQTNTG